MGIASMIMNEHGIHVEIGIYTLMSYIIRNGYSAMVSNIFTHRVASLYFGETTWDGSMTIPGSSRRPTLATSKKDP